MGMGKASRFLKSLFGYKPTERRWTFFKSHKNKPSHHYSDQTPLHHRHSDQTAPHAAVEVKRFTTTTAVAGGEYGFSGGWAAVKIQSYFRGYLARKALRALKSLVMLQALVRGQIQRKQHADVLRRYHALVRAQSRARASRFQITESPQSTTKGPPTPEKFEYGYRSRVVKHNQPSILKNNGSRLYDERNERILEVDTMKHHTRRRSLFQPDQMSYTQSQSLTTSHPFGLSPSGSCESGSVYTAQSPPFYAKTGSMRVGPFTPAKSDSSKSCLSGYSDYPNYMAYTESSRAKVRSLSAPRQRPAFELPSTTKRYSVYGYGSGAQRGSNLRDSFASKAYPGSGRLDRLGMPVGVGFRESEFSGGYWN